MYSPSSRSRSITRPSPFAKIIVVIPDAKWLITQLANGADLDATTDLQILAQADVVLRRWLIGYVNLFGAGLDPSSAPVELSGYDGADEVDGRFLPEELPRISAKEPCLCGSGRKYKRCCGQSKKFAFQPLRDVW